MGIYVIVHGGFSGGWRYREVAQRLRTAGHEVFTPTLTGLGERAHLANPEINLSTHIQDIVGVLECEDLWNVILAGSSYGSMVITGVAERVPERLSRLVYIDAPVPKDGQSWCDLLGTEVTQLIIETAKQKGDGWLIPLFPNPPRYQPHPLKPCTDPLEVRNPDSVQIPRAFFHCTARATGTLFDPFWPRVDKAAEEVRRQGWWYRAIATGHDANIVDKPQQLSELLLELA